ncbi:YojF family protein [Priestia taiwanensis]|uniref:DUF1806 domain-containing protein n=1 Tax=Priestia taiwanensis TaxID=1347902 RepID=A0A917ALP3_9BACI|nr:YojF family protein [Priestia taiwanensis]MBM7362280.1 hypothetical protein [Priestia taiwanensis]GGE60947.1 hypothetical protein GCM10007140_09020 [Priestia taiwanensis]
MIPIQQEEVSRALQSYCNKSAYLHLETTNGAYASHHNEKVMTVGAFIRNGHIDIERAKLAGNGPYRVGVKMQLGWVYAEGLTHYEIDEKGRLLLAGYDEEGRLAVAFQLSNEPF